MSRRFSRFSGPPPESPSMPSASSSMVLQEPEPSHGEGKENFSAFGKRTTAASRSRSRPQQFQPHQAAPRGMNGLKQDSEIGRELMTFFHDELMESVPDITEEELAAIYDLDDDAFSQFAQQRFENVVNKVNVSMNSDLKVQVDMNAAAGVRLFKGSKGEHKVELPPQTPQAVREPPVHHQHHQVSQQGVAVTPALQQQNQKAYRAGSVPADVEGGHQNQQTGVAGDINSIESRPTEGRPTPANIAEGVKIFGSPPEFNMFGNSPMGGSPGMMGENYPAPPAHLLANNKSAEERVDSMHLC